MSFLFEQLETMLTTLEIILAFCTLFFALVNVFVLITLKANKNNNVNSKIEDDENKEKTEEYNKSIKDKKGSIVEKVCEHNNVRLKLCGKQITGNICLDCGETIHKCLEFKNSKGYENFKCSRTKPKRRICVDPFCGKGHVCKPIDYMIRDESGRMRYDCKCTECDLHYFIL